MATEIPTTVRYRTMMTADIHEGTVGGNIDMKYTIVCLHAGWCHSHLFLCNIEQVQKICFNESKWANL